jgi:hypothetical protein
MNEIMIRMAHNNAWANLRLHRARRTHAEVHARTERVVLHVSGA